MKSNSYYRETSLTTSSIDTITGILVKRSILYQIAGKADSTKSQRVLGFKQYELSNHLGNTKLRKGHAVFAVVSDKRIFLEDVILGYTDTTE